MVALLPPKKLWLWILLGMLLTVLLSFVLPLAFLFVALLFAFIAPGPGGKLRKFFMYLFYFLGAFFVLVGVLVALGLTVAGFLGLATGALSGLFTIAAGIVIGAILVLIGVVLFVIGNFIAD